MTYKKTKPAVDWSAYRDWAHFRARIEHEDALLNSRSGIFLVVNGLGGVAVGLAQPSGAVLVITVVMLLVNGLWMAASLQMVAAIKALTRIYTTHASDQSDGIVRDSMKHWPRWFRNTDIVGRFLPITLLGSWCVALAFLFSNPSEPL